MICRHCKGKNHEACKAINAGKTPSACDCQHRTEQKNIVAPQLRTEAEEGNDDAN